MRPESVSQTLNDLKFKVLKRVDDSVQLKALKGDETSVKDKLHPLAVPQNELLAFLTLVKIQLDLCLGNRRVAAPLGQSTSFSLSPDSLWTPGGGDKVQVQCTQSHSTAMTYFYTCCCCL